MPTLVEFEEMVVRMADGTLNDLALFPDLVSEADIARLHEQVGVSLKAFNPTQPRDERGQWSSADASGGLRQYVDLVAGMEANAKQPGVASYLKAHGRVYPTDEKSFVGGQVHQCYKNAALAALTGHSILSGGLGDAPDDPDDAELTYVEGYVSVHGVPIEHAWTVNKRGVVRDVTLASPKGIRGYFGVPIKKDFLNKQLLRTKRYGILVGSDNFKATRAVIEADPAKVIAE